MASDLTEADLVDYDVAFNDGVVVPARGAYITTDVTGLLAIKDHRHKHVLLVRPEVIQYIGRRNSGGPDDGTRTAAPRTAVWQCGHGTAIAGPDFIPCFRGPCGCEMQPVHDDSDQEQADMAAIGEARAGMQPA